MDGQPPDDEAAATAVLAAAADLLVQSTALRELAACDLERAVLAQRLAQRDRDAARVDDLTGALRRGSGYAALQRLMDACHEAGAAMVLAFVDIDDMKGVNDTLGHLAGDELLRVVAAGLLSAVRDDGVVVRFGGDEFVCGLRGTLGDATVRLDVVRAAIGRHHGTSISAGVAAMRAGETLEQLIARADLELYGRRSQVRRSARTGPADPPVGEVTIDELSIVTARCMDLLRVDAVGVLLTDGTAVPTVAAVSSEVARLLARIQLVDGAGPSLDVHATGQPVRHPDLRKAVTRWPAFALAATRAGVHWVQVLPVRSRGTTAGALTLFGGRAGSLDDLDLPLARTLADVAGLVITQDASQRSMRVQVRALQLAVTRREAIEQAKGMLAERADIGIDDALDRLRDHARRTGGDLTSLVEQVIAGTVPLSELVPEVAPLAVRQPGG